MKVGAAGDYPSRFRGGIFDLFSNLWYNKNEKHFKNEIEANCVLILLNCPPHTIRYIYLVVGTGDKITMSRSV